MFIRGNITYIYIYIYVCHDRDNTYIYICIYICNQIQIYSILKQPNIYRKCVNCNIYRLLVSMNPPRKVLNMCVYMIPAPVLYRSILFIIISSSHLMQVVNMFLFVQFLHDPTIFSGAAKPGKLEFNSFPPQIITQ